MPPDGPDDERIQREHIRYLMSLAESGVILANGPVKRQDDPMLRGLSLYSVDADSARSHASKDPAVVAGWFRLVVDEWLIPARPRMIGDRTDLTIDVPL